MKTSYLFRKIGAVVSLLLLSHFQSLKALEYTYAFKASVDSVTIDSVYVENLTRDTLVKLGGQDVLKLVDVIVGQPLIFSAVGQRLSVSPNPTGSGQCTVVFESTSVQEATFDVVDLAGRLLLRRVVRLEKGSNQYMLKHLVHGMTYVVVTTPQRRYVGKVVSTAPEGGAVHLQQCPAVANGPKPLSTTMETTARQAHVGSPHNKVVYMLFEPGDWLRITAQAGVDKSVRVVAPVGGDTLAIAFYRCIDADGHSYPTVSIGEQVWMAENLKTTRYKDSTTIHPVTELDHWTFWADQREGAYGWYENDSLNALPFGALYNGHAVLSGKLAPKGWHVATATDFDSLFAFVNEDPSTLMAAWKGGWDTLPLPRYDSTGFAALGSGAYVWGTYDGRCSRASFWTSTQVEAATAPRPHFSASIPHKAYYHTDLVMAAIDAWGTYLDISNHGNAHAVRCVLNRDPKVRTDSVRTGKVGRAVLGGRVTSDGGEGIVVCGFCLSRTQPEPTLEDSVIPAIEGGMGTFYAVLDGLETGTSYYARAFASNDVGLGYGEVQRFTPVDPGTVTDVDGHVYPVVQIGDLFWMAENLRVTHLNDSTPLPMVNDSSAWATLDSAAYCLYDSTETVGVDGYLYNHLVVQTQKLAPKGWHVPTVSEWETLMEALLNDDRDDEQLARALRSNDTVRWEPWIGAGNDLSGFSATPAGTRYPSGEASYQGVYANWWTTNRDPWSASLYYYGVVLSDYVYTTSFEQNYGLSVRCIKDYPARLTTCLKTVRQTQATIGVEVDEAGGVLSRLGVCLSASDAQPDVASAMVVTFDACEVQAPHWFVVDTLKPDATYYVRAFAENSTGISYGETLCFQTQSADTVVDLDGNVYHTIKIGSQTWMVENLKTTKYNDGTAIGVLSGFHSTTPGYCIYANNSSNKDTYGLLYNWYAVNTGKLAPNGWRVPSQADWQVLLDYLGGEEVAGGKLKEAGLTHWESPNTDAMDWGFAALPGGTRDGGAAIFRTLKSRGWWWTSTPATQDYNAYTMGLVSWMGSAYLGEGYKSDAFSVRCIKEED